MPFKTRKQKESASARRFSFSNNQVVWGNAKGSSNNVDKKEVIVKEVSKVKTTKDSMFEITFLASGLVRIFVIASAIILLQVILRFFVFN